jgi:hypothetical protein
MTENDLTLVWTCSHCGREFSTPPDPAGSYPAHVRRCAVRARFSVVADVGSQPA